jgi:hypothetical protein
MLRIKPGHALGMREGRIKGKCGMEGNENRTLLCYVNRSLPFEYGEDSLAV